MLKTSGVSNANHGSTRNVYVVNVSNGKRKYMTLLNAVFGLSMHGRFMLTPANVLFLELRYEILKFFMHTSFLYNLEDILQEKSANYMLSWKIHTSSANRWFSSEWYSCTKLKIKYISFLAVLSILIPNRGGSKRQR